MNNLTEVLKQKFRDKFYVQCGSETKVWSFDPEDVEAFLSEVYQRGYEDGKSQIHDINLNANSEDKGEQQ